MYKFFFKYVKKTDAADALKTTTDDACNYSLRFH